MTLLGTWVRDFCDGDIRRREDIEVFDEEIEGSAHAERVMASYVPWLASREVQALHLLGLFDRPAETVALEAVRAMPMIRGLTDELADDRAWRKALTRLRKARLVLTSTDDGTLDAHPLVRAYFGERLREASTEAWRAGHERLYEHYRTSVDELPDTLEGLMPLYAAVVHGCRAGRVQGACKDVYRRRILRGDDYFSLYKLGAFGAELATLAAFFDWPWNQPSEMLTGMDRAWILNQAGFVLRASGRLHEASQLMRKALKARVEMHQWRKAAITAGNLSELRLALGDVAGAVAIGEESVELADRSEDLSERKTKRATLADALHQAGRWEECAPLFYEAEAIQLEAQPQYQFLYSWPGHFLCDWLQGSAEPEDGTGWEKVEPRLKVACQEMLSRATSTIEIARSNNWTADIALDHLTLARANLGLALAVSGTYSDSGNLTLKAAEHMGQAVDGLREAGYEDHLPRGLLARAAFHRLTHDLDAAARDLAEALEIAERGAMRLHEADAHLELTRLHLAKDDEDAEERDTARRHLERARQLVRETGYGRREREVAYLEGRLGLR